MRNILCALVFVVLAIVAIPVVVVCGLFGWGDAFLAYGTWMMRVGRWILGIDVEAEGLGRIDPAERYIFMCNHLSFLDAPLLLTVLRRPVRFIVKRFVFRIPVLGLGMKFAGFVPVDKGGLGEGRKRIARAAELIKTKGYSFLVYPEGTRSWEGTLLPFRRGGFFLALETGVPIAPISVRGTYELMPRGSKSIRKGKVRIIFHEPVPVAGTSVETMPELMERVRAAIASALPPSPPPGG